MTSNSRHPTTTAPLPPPGLLASLAHSWRLLVVATVGGMLLGAAVAAVATPRYEATATVLLTDPGETTIFRSANGRDLERRLIRATEDLRSRAVVAAAANRMGSAWGPGQVRAAIQASTDTTRNRIVVTGRASTGSTAARLANTVVTAYRDVAATQNRATTEEVLSRLDAEVVRLDEVVRSTSTQLDDLRLAAEEQLAGLPVTERIGLATQQLAGDPEAQVLERRRDDAAEEAEFLRQEARKIRIDTALYASGIESMELADSPIIPSWPRLQREVVLGGALLLLLAGVGTWIRVERRPQSVSGIVAAHHLGLAVLADIRPRRRRWHTLRPPREEAGSTSRRPYQLAASGLAFAQERVVGNSVLVTGATAEEPTTVVAVRLTLAAARDGQRVTLVDGDVRNASLTHAMQLHGQRGWNDDTPQGQERESCLHALEVGTDRVPVQVAPVDDELATPPRDVGKSFRRTIRALEQGVDLVVVDAPPLLPLGDTSVLAPGVSGIVLVLQARVEPDTLHLLQQRLAVIDTPVLGCIVGGTGAESFEVRSHSDTVQDVAAAPPVVPAPTTTNGDRPRVSRTGPPLEGLTRSRP